MADEGEKGQAAPLKADLPARKRASRDPQVFVLLRELSEVHLLLDNVSANPTTTVSDRAAVKRPKELKANWIEDVCQISWPPDGSNDEKAEDAALLIRAKDHLNRLSHPASGASIAFTLLVTQGGAGKKGWLRRRIVGGDVSPTRNTLAQTAYPDLVAKAVTFRLWMMWICGGLVAALILTCALSWYVAYGNAALAEYATSREALDQAQTRVNEAEVNEVATPTERVAENGSGEAATPAAPGSAPGSTAATPTAFEDYCARGAYTGAAQAQLCDARDRAQASLSLVQRRLADWQCWSLFSDCEAESKIADAPSRAAALATIMGSAVLPFLYGLLGAGAAIIRSLSRKIRTSRLSPRDLVLSFQQLALGAVVGACIGLFIADPGADATGESLLGPVTLSASAISFVAGFGVESVFQALEALISRIFNISPAAPAARGGDSQPGN